MKKTNTAPGGWLVVLGAGGGVGHFAVQIAHKAFGLRVIGIDQSSKRSLVQGSGAEVFIDLDQGIIEEIIEKVKTLTDGVGADAVVVCAASNPAYASGVDMLRPGGTLVGVGMPGGGPAPIATASPGRIVKNELRILGSMLGNRQDAIDVLALAARGIVVSHYDTTSMSDLNEVSKSCGVFW